MTINLGGMGFTIDEPAYNKLLEYLETIKGYFENSEGKDEIMQDIESRISEMLLQKHENKKQVIISADIDAVIAVLGQPEDFVEDGDEPKKAKTTESNRERKRLRKLYRDPDSRVLGGVCSGVGHYFGVDAIVLRIILLIAFFFFGSGLLLYIILWIIVPKANTTAEKLEMKGEPVTFDKIGNAVEEKAKHFQKDFEKYRNGKSSEGFKSFLDSFFGLLKNIFYGLANIFGRIIQFAGKAIGLIFIAGAVIAMIPMYFLLFEGDVSNVSFQGGNLFIQSFSSLKSLIFTNQFDLIIAQIGASFILFIPLFLIILLGLALIQNFKGKYGIPLALLFTLFFIGILATTYTSIKLVKEFNSEGKYVQKATLPAAENDLIFVDVNESALSQANFLRIGNGQKIWFQTAEDLSYLGFVTMNVRKSKIDSTYVEINQLSRGSNVLEAIERAEKMIYTFSFEDNRLQLDPYFVMRNEDKWRGQHIEVNLFVPVNTKIYFEDGTSQLANDFFAFSNIGGRDIEEKYWIMEHTGLRPLNENE